MSNEIKIEALAKQLEELQKTVAEQATELETVKKNNKILTGNLNFLKDLAHECVALTEQSSSIALEQYNTLDSRMNEVVVIARQRILNELAKIPPVETAAKAVEEEWSKSTDEEVA